MSYPINPTSSGLSSIAQNGIMGPTEITQRAAGMLEAIVDLPEVRTLPHYLTTYLPTFTPDPPKHIPDENVS